MKHALDVSPDGRTFTIATMGNGDVEGIMAFLNAIVNHAQWQPGHHILLDHRNLNIAGISVEGIDQVSQYFQDIGPLLGEGKIALVMDKDIDFGIARAWELVTQDHVDIKIGVFRSIDEAQQWLKTFPE